MRIAWRGTTPQVQKLVSQLGRAVAGRPEAPELAEAAKGIQLRMGVVLLSKVQQAFIIKSRGGTGSDGIQWPPLDPRTIAARRSRYKGTRRPPDAPRGLLTQKQDRFWRRAYASLLSHLLAQGEPLDRAREIAARTAWARVIKEQNADTLIAKYGKKKVDVLRDTGELLRSLQPGFDDQPSGAPGQVFRLTAGNITVGTNKKPWHHRGIPGRLPARPLWPDQLPLAWRKAIIAAARRGMTQAVIKLLQGGPR